MLPHFLYMSYRKTIHEQVVMCNREASGWEYRFLINYSECLRWEGGNKGKSMLGNCQWINGEEFSSMASHFLPLICGLLAADKTPQCIINRVFAYIWCSLLWKHNLIKPYLQPQKVKGSHKDNVDGQSVLKKIRQAGNLEGIQQGNIHNKPTKTS